METTQPHSDDNNDFSDVDLSSGTPADISEKTEKEDTAYTLERIGPEDPRFETAKKLEFDVFKLSGFLEDGDEEAGELLGYKDYDQGSVFNAVLEGDKIVGILREIRPNPKGFKTLNDFALYESAQRNIQALDQGKIVEIGTLGIPPESRKQFDIAQRLYGMAYQNSLQGSYRYWITSLDTTLLDAFKEVFKFKFHDIGDPKFYMGSSTTPAMLDLEEAVPYLKENNLEQYNKIVLGKFDAEKAE